MPPPQALRRAPTNNAELLLRLPPGWPFTSANPSAFADCSSAIASTSTIHRTCHGGLAAALIAQQSQLRPRFADSSRPAVVVVVCIGLPGALNAIRFVSHYLLFGADRIVMVDNPLHWNQGCRNLTQYEENDRALAPFVKSGLVVQIKDLRCVRIIDTPAPWEQLPNASSSDRRSPWWTQAEHKRNLELVVLTVMGALNRSSVARASDLIVSVDEDERLFVTSDQHDLHDVHHHMLNRRICSLYVNWRIFGSSGLRCPALYDMSASFVRRLRTETEANASEKRSAFQEARRYKMHAPYFDPAGRSPPPGKSSLWLLHGAPMCGRGWHGCSAQEVCNDRSFSLCASPMSAGKNPSCRALLSDSIPSTGEHLSALPFEVRIHHYTFQSWAQWEEKKLVWQRTHGRLFGNDPPPSRYDEVEDTSLVTQVRRRLRRVPDSSARRCLHLLLLASGTDRDRL